MQKTSDDPRKKILSARHAAPFSYLGPHAEGKSNTAIHAFLPEAKHAWVDIGKERLAMQPDGQEGFYTLTLEGVKPQGLRYELEVQLPDGSRRASRDPYSFQQVLTDFDLHLIAEGTHYKKYEKLGAHIMDIEGARGVHFAVWAPNAKGVSVIGDFNTWDGRRHPMRLLGASGIWEVFIPGLDEGTIYKYEIKDANTFYVKTDPYGFFSENRPNTASVVWDINKFTWSDDKWLADRKDQNPLDFPMSTYEVHLGSWMRGPEGEFINYRELAHKLVAYAKKMGFTHLELLPVNEHPLDASWGYQSLGYFAVTRRFGTPEDFMYFVDYCHQHCLGVIIDWVPAHFPKDAHGLAYFDGTFLYEHAHPFQREHMDWGTLIFNYGRTEVASFLLNSALFWLEKYHIDGLRVDAVASMLYLDYSRKQGQWIPNKYGSNENLEAIAFIKRFNELCHEQFPGVLTIAEESTAWSMVSRPTYSGGLGFSLKWNMGWMHDTLLYFSKNPIYRKYEHHNVTFSMIYAFNENFTLVLSHDEVVHGKRSLLDKMPGDMWQKFANLRLLLGLMYGHPGKKLLFMGCEFGQWAEWNFDKALDWHLLQYEPHSKLQEYVQDLNLLLMSEPSLFELDFDYRGFEWIDFSDSDASVISYIRKAKDPQDYLVFVFNLTPVPRKNYRVGVRELVLFKELLNSDSQIYFGSNMGNAGWVMPEQHRVKQWPYSLKLTLPPLGMLVLKPFRPDEEATEQQQEAAP